jgi:hypothetical protein
VAAALLAGLVAVLALYQPQKLFIETTLDEALPSAVPAVVAPTPTSVPAGPRELAADELRGLAHRGSGQVRLLALADGARVLRLVSLDVENGPDLHVYLADAPPTPTRHSSAGGSPTSACSRPTTATRTTGCRRVPTRPGSTAP